MQIRHRFRAAALLLTLVGLLASMQPVAAQEPDFPLSLLTDPYLQLPTESSVQVAWVTEFPGAVHFVLYGELVRRLPDAALERLAERSTARLDEAQLERALTSSVSARLPLRVAIAETIKLSRTREDASSRVPGRSYTGVVERDLWRHEATVDGLEQGERVPYRVLSVSADGDAARATPSRWRRCRSRGRRNGSC